MRQEILPAAQKDGRELHALEGGQTLAVRDFIPDSHFSAGNDYYCYF